MLFSERYCGERGVDIRWVHDPMQLDQWAAAIDDGTRFVYGELPSNPQLAMFDVRAVADLAHSAGLPLIVDSTIATPALLRPLALGADIVVQSLTKAIGGSGLAIGGAVLSRRAIPSRVGPDEMRDDFAMWVKLHPFRDHGPALSPQAAHAFLVDVRTLRPRVDQWSRSAMAVATFLAEHPGGLRWSTTRACPPTPVTRSRHATCDSSTATSSAATTGATRTCSASRSREGPQPARRFFDGSR